MIPLSDAPQQHNAESIITVSVYSGTAQDVASFDDSLACHENRTFSHKLHKRDGHPSYASPDLVRWHRKHSTQYMGHGSAAYANLILLSC